AQHPYKTQILDFHSCKTQWATRSLYFEGQKRNQFCILHYRLNLELLNGSPRKGPRKRSGKLDRHRD
ncbi:hypothetical protein, partial [Microcystis sp. M53602_WE12]|uniref:hypothetical protein n=1 Tax=Microcystis sp. M53602_WE12 TaxID=3030674 RepID=UPI00258C41A4